LKGVLNTPKHQKAIPKTLVKSSKAKTKKKRKTSKKWNFTGPSGADWNGGGETVRLFPQQGKGGGARDRTTSFDSTDGKTAETPLINQANPTRRS